MNCPRCGKPIGGYVQAGTIENSRVAKGCCPHCGSSMPPGYKVGYASSFAPPPPKKYDAEICKDMAEKGIAQLFVILLDGILLGITLSLSGRLVLGIISGVVLCIIFGGYVLLRPNIYFPMGETTISPPGNTTIWLAWASSLFFSFTSCASEEVLPKGWPFLLAGFALNAFFTVKNHLPPYEKAKKSFTEQKRDKQLVERILELYNEGKLTCGKCGKSISSHSHFSFSLKDSGAIILCSDCLPVMKSGVKELGGLSFYQF